ncbi:MAG TPA: cache domain-containing protein, partial [Casimicrobiaceae bacterium]|nr:cache domain-containing protein [Casimicrobiaceae bacterium]
MAKSLCRLYHELTAPAVRAVLFIPVFGALLVAALWTAVVVRLTLDCETMFRDAMEDVESFVATFEEHSIRALRDLDRTALLVKSDIERDGAVDFAGLTRDGLLASDTFVQASVADRNGDVVASTLPLPFPVNVSDREHFRVHQARDSRVAFFSRPFVDRVTHRRIFALTRRLNGTNGAFAGVIVAAVDPRFFTDFYQERYLGRHGLIAVLGTDGAFRARRIGDQLDMLGDGSRASVLQRLKTTPAGSYRSKSPVDGVDRLIAYRKLPDLPLVVIAGRAESEIMARYEERRSVYVLIASTVTTAIVVFFAVATILFYRLRRSQARALEAEALFRAAADAGLDSFAVMRALRDQRDQVVDFVIAEANPRAAALLEVGADTIARRRLLPVLRRAGVSSLLERYIRVLETGVALEEEIELKPPGRPSLWLRHQVVRARDGIAIMARDITKAKQDEEQLRQRTAFLQALVQNVPVGVFVRSACPESMGRVVVWNEASEYMYGATAAQTLGRTFRDFGPDGYVQRIEEM